MMQLSGMGDLCMINYVTVNHGMLSVFVERRHSETSSLHLSHLEMYITLDGVSWLLHLPIRGTIRPYQDFQI